MSTDLGHAHRLRPVQFEDILVGYIVEHPDARTGDECYGGAIWLDTAPDRFVRPTPDGPPRPVWHVEQAEPLTLSPSLLCTLCHDHGFVRRGAWEPA